METSISQINFNSRIKLISPKVFEEKTKVLDKVTHEIEYPWTPAQIKEGENLFTLGVLDCVAGGIVHNGKVRAFHQANWSEDVAKQHSEKVFSPKELELKLFDGIDIIKEKAHAFILGGLIGRDSKEGSFLSKVKSVFTKNNIPLTEITRRKDVHYYGKYSLLYENKTDTWFVTNNLIEHTGLNGKGFEIELKGPNVEYNTYGPASEGYPRTRKITSVKEFFEQQFNDVNLSDLDTFV